MQYNLKAAKQLGMATIKVATSDVTGLNAIRRLQSMLNLNFPKALRIATAAATKRSRL